MEVTSSKLTYGIKWMCTEMVSLSSLKQKTKMATIRINLSKMQKMLHVSCPTAAIEVVLDLRLDYLRIGVATKTCFTVTFSGLS